MKRMIYPGREWLDTDGVLIQAHGGGILFHGGIYYWFGENKEKPNTPGTTHVPVTGVNCYSSQDLIQWKNAGVVLPADDGELHPANILERPKVIYNRQTRQFVMWMHVDSPDYRKACTGVAVSDRVTGPYRYLGGFQPNGKDSRDMTIYQDDDGKAYLVHSSDWNSCTIIADLSADYLKPTGHFTRHFDHGAQNTGRESPALFKQAGKYYCITSGCTGWFANAAESAVADSIHGPWQVQGNPCVGQKADTTFDAQSTFVLPVNGQFIFMADRWNKDDLRNSRYVWLPLQVQGGAMRIEWHEAWELTKPALAQSR